MNVDTLREMLESPEASADWLGRMNFSDPDGAHASLVRIATSGMTLDLFSSLVGRLEKDLPGCADPNMVLHNFEDFISAARNPLAAGTYLERSPAAVNALVQIFSTSQHFSELIIADREGFDLLQLSLGTPTNPQVLKDTITAEVEAIRHDEGVLRALRRFKRRETLRIAFGDIVRDQPLEKVTSQISYLADALVEAAFQAACRNVSERYGDPWASETEKARVTILALGKLGGLELNYSSDIDLILLYDGEGKTDAQRPITNAEYFQRATREMVRLLTEGTELGSVYRVDLRLRPDGSQGAMVPSVQTALQYYDFRGRTWERQAMIKARPIAGDLELGKRFLEQLQPWIYRRHLSHADINGIKQLKRKIEKGQRHDRLNVKTGDGGIRDIEFVIQFLQLLNGAELPEVRTGTTLEAIVQLTRVGCLDDTEATLLRSNYLFLRKVEHRLQIMFDLQTHTLPPEDEEQRKLAIRCGFKETPQVSALDAFRADLRRRMMENRRILDHLLHDAFPDEDEFSEEVDLVLDPEPSEDQIDRVLSRYGFKDTRNAYRILGSLSEENIRFLSPRRCRHFLAGIAPNLLSAIGETADPDATLVALDQVSGSLGGKALLWELFSFSQPTLDLFVQLCAGSPYLCSILTSQPGMIDGLMDSLVQDRLPSRELLETLLEKLCYAAEDIDPILHSFKSDQLLRVGVRDILGRDSIRRITASLSDIAEVCLAQVVRQQYRQMVGRYGQPIIAEGRRKGEICEMSIVGLGKFGGREINYHSDLDVIFLYEADGQTSGGRAQTTTNRHFFGEVGSRIIKTVSRLTQYGRLYEVDSRLRPSGKGGNLAVSFDDFDRYFSEGPGQLWERQALCKARVIGASDKMTRRSLAAIGRAAFSHRWRLKDAIAIRDMRKRLEDTVGPGNIKRGAGGIVDVEFLVQLLQLKHGRGDRSLRQSGTFEALDALHDAGILDNDEYLILAGGYRLLRTVEGRLRLISETYRDELPGDPVEQAKIARMLSLDSVEELKTAIEITRSDIRECFNRRIEAETARG